MKNITTTLAAVAASVGLVWAVAGAGSGSDNGTEFAKSAPLTSPVATTSYADAPVMPTGESTGMLPPEDPSKVAQSYAEDGVTVGIYDGPAGFPLCVTIGFDGASAFACFEQAQLDTGSGYVRLQNRADQPGLLVGVTNEEVTRISIDAVDVSFGRGEQGVWVAKVSPDAKSFRLMLADGSMISEDLPQLPPPGL